MLKTTISQDTIHQALNKTHLVNNSLKTQTKELSSEIFLDRLNLLFENQEAEGSF